MPSQRRGHSGVAWTAVVFPQRAGIVKQPYWLRALWKRNFRDSSEPYLIMVVSVIDLPGEAFADAVAKHRGISLDLHIEQQFT
jgi:hypothetical protein